MKIVTADSATLDEVAASLRAGGVAVIPTDTVYGLAAWPGCADAVDRLYTIKGREQKKPIALLAADADAARELLGGELPRETEELMHRHWPGALTLVMRGEGLRVPDHAWTRELLRRMGGVLRVTSANLSGRREATDAPQALRDVGLEADVVVDDGISPGGVASTVLKVEDDGAIAVLRPGPKPVLRTAMKLIRARVTDAAAQAQAVSDRLFARDDIRRVLAARSPIAAYLAVGDELDLAPFIAAATANGARLCAPRWNGGGYEMAELGATTRLGPHAIPEPDASASVVPADAVAVWIAPGLAFTAAGDRLGYGGGWYDRFFAQASPAALRLGVAYREQLLSSLPVEPHDRRLDAVVSAC